MFLPYFSVTLWNKSISSWSRATPCDCANTDALSGTCLGPLAVVHPQTRKRASLMTSTANYNLGSGRASKCLERMSGQSVCTGLGRARGVRQRFQKSVEGLFCIGNQSVNHKCPKAKESCQQKRLRHLLTLTDGVFPIPLRHFLNTLPFTQGTSDAVPRPCPDNPGEAETRADTLPEHFLENLGILPDPRL